MFTRKSMMFFVSAPMLMLNTQAKYKLAPVNINTCVNLSDKDFWIESPRPIFEMLAMRTNYPRFDA
jgi:hypothetical protein